ncbi:hypothetical protein SDC9_27456 [bioreactor metagenome]|uniref:Uncharacterized protein n=1 Tax=bioreactor metagenome TaxID=1076179 RepID=A0A644UR78_9ZZZZ
MAPGYQGSEYFIGRNFFGVINFADIDLDEGLDIRLAVINDLRLSRVQ